MLLLLLLPLLPSHRRRRRRVGRWGTGAWGYDDDNVAVAVCIYSYVCMTVGSSRRRRCKRSCRRHLMTRRRPSTSSSACFVLGVLMAPNALTQAQVLSNWIGGGGVYNEPPTSRSDEFSGGMVDE